HGAHRDAGGGGNVGAAVAGAVSERIGAVVVGIRRVGKAAVAVQRERTVARASDERGRERIAVEVAVISQHAGGGDDQRNIFVRPVCFPYTTLFRSHGAHRDAGGGGNVGAAVAGAVSERVGAVVVGGGRVGEGTITIEREQAVARA